MGLNELTFFSTLGQCLSPSPQSSVPPPHGEEEPGSLPAPPGQPAAEGLLAPGKTLRAQWAPPSFSLLSLGPGEEQSPGRDGWSYFRASNGVGGR